MSKLVNGRIKTPNATHIPKLHTLAPPPLLPEYVAEAGPTSARSSASIAVDLLSTDYGDFLTRRLALSSEKGHIINAVRTDHTLAKKMADFIIENGLVPGEISTIFTLEHHSNLICIGDGLHPLYGEYGVFAYLPSDEVMDWLLEVIEDRNKFWQGLVNVSFTKPDGLVRDLIGSIGEERWTNFTYEIGILLPDHFLPFGQMLLIRDPHPESDPLGVSYITTTIIDKELCIIPTQPDAADSQPVIYPPFVHLTTRSMFDRVNPFFLCINATDKYEYHCRKYGTGTMSRRVDALFQKAKRIVALLFPSLMPVPGSRVAREMEERKRKREEEEEEEEDAKEGGKRKSARIRSKTQNTAVASSSKAMGGHDSETVENGDLEVIGSGQSEEATDDQRSDLSIDMDETRDADGDLAFFDATKAKLEEPGLSEDERTSLVLQLLFGGRGYETPHMPGVPDPPSVFDRIINGDYVPYERPEVADPE